MQNVQDPNVGPAKQFPKHTGFIILLLLVVVALFVGSFYGGDSSSTSRTTTSAPAVKNLLKQKVGDKIIIEVMLDPVDWSDWIHLPSGTPYDLDAHGWHEYEFDLGQGKTKKVKIQGPKKPLGNVPSSSFRLRGRKQLATVSYKMKR